MSTVDSSTRVKCFFNSNLNLRIKRSKRTKEIASCYKTLVALHGKHIN